MAVRMGEEWQEWQCGMAARPAAAATGPSAPMMAGAASEPGPMPDSAAQPHSAAPRPFPQPPQPYSIIYYR